MVYSEYRTENLVVKLLQLHHPRWESHDGQCAALAYDLVIGGSKQQTTRAYILFCVRQNFGVTGTDTIASNIWTYVTVDFSRILCVLRGKKASVKSIMKTC